MPGLPSVWLQRRVSSFYGPVKVGPYLLRATRDLVGMGLVLSTALLETRGAKTGVVRRNTVIYFHDSDRVTIVASKAGAEKHPPWFHNLLANPDVLFGGIPMRAAVVSDEAERRRLWALADCVGRSGSSGSPSPLPDGMPRRAGKLTAREPDVVA